MTLYQDQIAHAPDVKAMIVINSLCMSLGASAPLAVVERLSDGLWLGYTEGVSLEWVCEGLKVGGRYRVKQFPTNSLAVPFRDSIRSQFKIFIRVSREAA